MNIPIHRIDKNFPLPEYHSAGAVAFDMYARVDAVVAPRGIARLPSNLIIGVPTGHVLIIAPRSSTAAKKGLVFPNSAGIIDQDYHGPTDEIQIQVMNVTDAPVEIKAGERIAQGMIVPVARATWIESDEFLGANRGGFGSTGGYHT
ncbi:dUTP diphosphatase [Candidatus Berkelbacteria bacterium]|nr:dUTP diphosphatase [Candidatus Berkelbacteria bacterium]